MENQTYKIGQEFKTGKENRNEYLTGAKITSIREGRYNGIEYKLTAYMVTPLTNGKVQKSQRSTWMHESNIQHYLNMDFYTL
jgi:hypothetical protein